MKDNFKVGEIVYLTHGVGELNIQAVMINKLVKRTAIVVTCLSGREFKVCVGSLIRDRDLMQEVFDYIKNTQKR